METDLLQWLKDNSDFEDEEKVEYFSLAQAYRLSAMKVCVGGR